MNLFVLGATGRTGRSVVDKALARGHTVTALVRTPLSPARERLTTVVGDPRRIDDLLAALPGHDAVVSCLGASVAADRWLVSESASAVVAAMKVVGLKRYVVQSGALLFPSWHPVIVSMRFFMRDKLRDASEMERIVSASDADWTVVRPPHLSEGMTPTGYRTKAWARPSGNWASLQFIDLADFIVTAVENRQFVRQMIGIAPS